MLFTEVLDIFLLNWNSLGEDFFQIGTFISDDNIGKGCQFLKKKYKNTGKLVIS